MNGSPSGRSFRVSGQSRTICHSRRPPQRAGWEAGPASRDGQLSVTAAGRSGETGGSPGGAPTTRRRPSSRTASTAASGCTRIRDPTPDRTASPACSTVAARASAAPASRQDLRPDQGPAQRGRHIGQARQHQEIQQGEAHRDDTGVDHLAADGPDEQHHRCDQRGEHDQDQPEGRAQRLGAPDRLGQRGHAGVQRSGPPGGVQHQPAQVGRGPRDGTSCTAGEARTRRPKPAGPGSRG